MATAACARGTGGRNTQAPLPFSFPVFYQCLPLAKPNWKPVGRELRNVVYEQLLLYRAEQRQGEGCVWKWVGKWGPQYSSTSIVFLVQSRLSEVLYPPVTWEWLATNSRTVEAESGLKGSCFLHSLLSFLFWETTSLYLRSKRIAIQETLVQAETQMVFLTL